MPTGYVDCRSSRVALRCLGKTLGWGNNVINFGWTRVWEKHGLLCRLRGQRNKRKGTTTKKCNSNAPNEWVQQRGLGGLLSGSLVIRGRKLPSAFTGISNGERRGGVRIRIAAAAHWLWRDDVCI